MDKGLQRIVFILVLIAGEALMGVLLLRLRSAEHAPIPLPPEQQLLFIEGIEQSLRVEVADTDEERVQGLSGRPALGDDEGMIFLFDTPGQPAFWMKDMRFPIDIIWVSSDWKVVDITEHLDPSTYPMTFSPKEDAQYVLEVATGFSDRHDITIGQMLVFKK